MRKLHAHSRHGSALPATGLHITFRNGRYEVRDSQQRFRCSFLTKEQADAWLRLRRQAEEMAAAEHWKETWQAEATSATQQASAAVAEMTQLRRQHEELQKRHEAVRLIYVERTQTALWAGAVRFLMN